MTSSHVPAREGGHIGHLLRSVVVAVALWPWRGLLALAWVLAVVARDEDGACAIWARLRT